ncbi:DUF7344 domain-containing protein [Halomarina litorea]|uniref:DUF7344 domain-containing protein n=1 Tax=Halomarina litorea TaxID=2961595 RepID=UPI0020C311B5|nr:hypothetical protein [Halomarina sp. BCD28]
MSNATARLEPDEETQEAELTEAEVFDVLSNQRRRFTYHYLKQADSPVVDLRQVVDHVAAWECEKEVRELTSAERNRVSTALHQFHLPKMDDCGFVEYDQQRGHVELSDPATELEVYLDVVPGPDVPWSRYYIGLAGVNAVVLAGVLVDVAPFSLLPPTSWLVFLVASLVVSAAAHTYLTRRMRLGSADDPPGRVER